MTRPLRIEYKNAYYHVMNRGGAQRDIFQHDEHRELFLELLREIHQMFRVEIHAYCLMDNHYHLLLSTPHSNLGRAMRHLNGVYTQRYNRLEKMDGPLYRGRYKAILVDADNYLLSVSRYIHLNPVEAGVVENPSDYDWSSYRQFIGEEHTRAWLNVSQTLGMIGVRNVKRRYKSFVEMGVDEETAVFYQKERTQAVFGVEKFVDSLVGKIKEEAEIPESRLNRQRIRMKKIVSIVAKEFGVETSSILKSRRGRGQKNRACAVSLYLSRKYAGLPLTRLPTTLT
ncbi:MAG: transposase [Gammaproteobacteria bacterium]|nr:transposase [Gammaproteobacteria bacterium]